jgi:NADH-quinone oxidoreductase subunit L
VTAFYSFRMYFLVFHGEERFGKAHAHDDHHGAAHAPHAAAHGAHGEHDSDAHHEVEEDDHGHHGLAPGEKPHESPFVVWFPLVMLAIPSVVIGFLTIGPMLFGDFFKGVIAVGESHKAMEILGEEFHGPMQMALHSLTTLPLWLAIAGVATAYYCYMVNPRVPAWFYAKFKAIHTLLDNKYYMDKFNDVVFAGGGRLLGNGLWNIGDRTLIDGLVVNGSAKVVAWISALTRLAQTGYIYHYAFVMIIGILGFLVYFLPFWHA